MNIAFIGSNPQNFISPIVKELLKKKKAKKSLLAFGNQSVVDDENELYDTFEINLIEKCSINLKQLLFSLSSLFNPDYWKAVKKAQSIKQKIKLLIFTKVFKSIEQYDIINVQQLQLPIEVLWLIKPNQKLFISFWGSDIYRANNSLISAQEEWIKRADHISLHHTNMEKLFLQRFPFYSKKITQCLFPLEPNIFNYLDKSPIRTSFETINVAIGYNANPAFQHIAVIKEIAQLPESLKNKIELKVFAAYGGSDSYLSEIKKNISIYKLRSEIYYDKTSLKVLADRRKKIDIMIQLSKSDAFSASIAEMLYAQCIMISGAWLPYNNYEENGVYFHQISNIASLIKTLETIMNSMEEEKNKCAANPNKVIETLDYDGNLGKWISIFEELYESNKQH